MRNIAIRVTLICVCLASIIHMSAGNGYTAIDPGSIVGIWLLDEGQGDLAGDTSGNGNDGTVVGGKWTEGMFGKALEFDGISHVEILASKTTDDFMDGFTYTIWAKPMSSPPNANTRVIERDWHNPTIQIGATDFYGSIAVNGDQASTHVRGGTWEMGEWSFVAITYDGAILKLYVDGKMVNEKDVGVPDAGPNNTPPPHEGAIWLGAWKAAGWDFKGVLDEAGVFNVPLSDGDIKNIMDNGLQSLAAVSNIGKMATVWGHVKGTR